jgi:hypothetical protein
MRISACAGGKAVPHNTLARRTAFRIAVRITCAPVRSKIERGYSTIDRETRFREARVNRRWQRRVGKANGSRECAPDDKLRVPTAVRHDPEQVGTARRGEGVISVPSFLVVAMSLARKAAVCFSGNISETKGAECDEGQ